MEYGFKISLITLNLFCHLITLTAVIKICFSQAVNKATDRVQFQHVCRSTSTPLIDWRGVITMK